MPNVVADIEYLKDLPLYKTEKPYLCLLPPRDDFDPDTERVDNLEFELHRNITVTDIRDTIDKYTLEVCGFQVQPHESKTLEFNTVDDVESYKRETEDLLRDMLGAEYVMCYELRTRKNVPFRRKQFDINDPLLVEGPAKGAHNGR